MDSAAATQIHLARRVERAFADVAAALASEAEMLPPAMLHTRIADVVRSSLFLSLETALQMQERVLRTDAAPAFWPPAVRWAPRALVITAVAADLYAGYFALRSRSSHGPDLVHPRDWQLQHERGAAAVLDTAVALGGTLIKAGQIASMHGDLLPAPYIERLATLQDSVPPHSWSTIEPTIVSELGRPLSEVFRRLDPEPVAAASLAQVHRGLLLDGRDVAVKVQYPEVQALVEADLAALEAIIGTLARVESAVRLQPILDHLRFTLPLELDFAHEAAAMTQLRAVMAHRADVVIPAVIPELCTQRLVVMEFVEGVKITDRDGMARAGIEAGAVATLLNDVYAEQMLKLGVLHADPHPGNLLVQPGPRLVLLDHGLTVELRPQLVDALARMVRALVAGDMAALSAALAGLGFAVDPEADVWSLLAVVGVLMGSAESSATSIAELGRSLGDIPVELLTVGRALKMLSVVTSELDPDLNVLDIVARHAASTPTAQGGTCD